ncbi:MAG: AlbA family DNA-binding domain-containing protein, partial [Phocaeicola sp.]
MRAENIVTEYKSIQKIRTGDKGFRSLAETCVALANSQGGVICIGVEDKTKQVPSKQIIKEDDINNAVTKLRSLCNNVVLFNSELLIDEEGGHYFTITISPSLRAIATTSDGKIYERVGDQCLPVRSEELITLAEKKGSYQWELVPSLIALVDIPSDNIVQFTKEIRASERVLAFIKEKEDIEILEHYHLVDGSVMTHLGVLWLGTSQQRGKLSYPITVQYIVFDHLENKIRKREWYDNSRNPKELILEIEKEAIELTYSYEFADGLFRKEVPHYNPKVLRELLVNAFV